MICKAQVGSFGYVGQYVVKKLGASRERDNRLKAQGYIPEFIVYSKANGGIGYRAFDPKRDFERGVIYAQNIERERYERVNIPRSFLNKVQRECRDPETLQLLDEFLMSKKVLARDTYKQVLSLQDDKAFKEYVDRQTFINSQTLHALSSARRSI